MNDTAWNWFIDLIGWFGNMWEWLSTPLDTGAFGNAILNEALRTPLSILTIGGITIVLVAKIIALAIPG